jgi:RNA polymerase sigma-70 factor, ECF subfamily
MIDESPNTSNMLLRYRNGEQEMLGAVFSHYRSRLRKMVQLRMDVRVAGRIDPSDVLQEVYLDVHKQIDAYLCDPKVSLHIWLRGLTWQRLLKIQRQHLGTQARDVRREVSLPAGSSARLAQQLLGSPPSASKNLLKKELQLRVQAAIAQLKDVDREIILLRDFENVSNQEAAKILGLSESAGTMRYVRALERLKQILESNRPPGESRP